MNKIDGITIGKLVEDYGSPLFIVSAGGLRKNLKAFREAFSIRFPKVKVAYSYKTNCLLGVLNIIHKSGAWADVASGFEYDLARALGVSGGSIVFNGPGKKREELRRAVEEGAFINADHLDEIKLLEAIASEMGRTIDLGIRINVDVGIHQSPDRFGFNLESGEAFRVVERCVKKKLLKIAGIHIHLTSYIIEPDGAEEDIPAGRVRLIWPKSPDIYREAAKKLVHFAEEIRKKWGVIIRYADLGGGFPSVDSLNPYVEAIVEPILDGFGGQDLPVLILEPGRAIVRDAIHLITTVVGIKEFPNGERGIVIDAGINLLPTSFWRWQEIESVDESQSMELKETTVYGPLCLQTDIIGKTKLPELKAGDKLIIKSVGAYNIPQSSTFIFPRPAIVLVEYGKARLLRREETIEDVFSFENL
ncbi:MAG TPA: alanine racemase [Thermodesulfobacteriota bacterium]|nr:alanine racemase [Thermodesulfobacteriota bacterium]